MADFVLRLYGIDPTGGQEAGGAAGGGASGGPPSQADVDTEAVHSMRTAAAQRRLVHSTVCSHLKPPYSLSCCSAQLRQKARYKEAVGALASMAPKGSQSAPRVEPVTADRFATRALVDGEGSAASTPSLATTVLQSPGFAATSRSSAPLTATLLRRKAAAAAQQYGSADAGDWASVTSPMVDKTPKLAAAALPPELSLDLGGGGGSEAAGGGAEVTQVLSPRGSDSDDLQSLADGDDGHNNGANGDGEGGSRSAEETLRVAAVKARTAQPPQGAPRAVLTAASTWSPLDEYEYMAERRLRHDTSSFVPRRRVRGGAVRSAPHGSTMNNASLSTRPAYTMPREERQVIKPPKYVVVGLVMATGLLTFYGCLQRHHTSAH